MAGVEETDAAVSGTHEDLRDKTIVAGLRKQRLDTVRLGANAVHQADVSTAAEVVDVVSAFERLVFARRER